MKQATYVFGPRIPASITNHLLTISDDYLRAVSPQKTLEDINFSNAPEELFDTVRMRKTHKTPADEELADLLGEYKNQFPAQRYLLMGFSPDQTELLQNQFDIDSALHLTETPWVSSSGLLWMKDMTVYSVDATRKLDDITKNVYRTFEL